MLKVLETDSRQSLFMSPRLFTNLGCQHREAWLTGKRRRSQVFILFRMNKPKVVALYTFAQPLIPTGAVAEVTVGDRRPSRKRSAG